MKLKKHFPTKGEFLPYRKREISAITKSAKLNIRKDKIKTV